MVGVVGVLAETIILSEALGVDPQVSFDAVKGGPLDLGYARLKGPAMIKRAFDDVPFPGPRPQGRRPRVWRQPSEVDMPDAESESAFEAEEEQAAAKEAAGIGGTVSDYPATDDDDRENDPAERPLIEAGEGESEGFELSEYQLEENASHGDMHSAGRILEDADGLNEDSRATDGGEADEEIKKDA